MSVFGLQFWVLLLYKKQAGGIGPTRCKITVMYLIDDVYMEKLKESYTWEETELVINNKFYEQVGVSNSIRWYLNNDYKEKNLGGRFIGEVYLSKNGNCIYREADDSGTCL